MLYNGKYNTIDWVYSKGICESRDQCPKSFQNAEIIIDNGNRRGLAGFSFLL